MRVVVAMSGGVDSSVAALQLVEAGHEVIGLSMQLYDQQQGTTQFGGCCSLDDLHDARRTAGVLGIPHYIMNFERQFDATVVSKFVREYADGRTPIPCVQCNADLKFAHLLDRAIALGAHYVATGHYVRSSPADGTRPARLQRGADADKDQSYFLFSLTQAQLSRALFPIGHLNKTEVRALAKDAGLPVANKPDSQELCFVPAGNTAAFVEARDSNVARSGPIHDRNGQEVGQHGGVHRYTVGQRKGLGLSTHEPLYVVNIDAPTNTLTVGPQNALRQTELTASSVNWIAGHPPGPLCWPTARIRHRHPDSTARVEALPEHRVSVVFDQPQRAIAPGQAVVFYDGNTVLGGGWID